MRVLITGAGLAGVHTAAELAAAGHTPALFDVAPDPDYTAAFAGPVPVMWGDVTDPASLAGALRRHGAEAVVHTAGLLQFACERHPYLAFRVNAGGAAAVAEAARQHGVTRLVHLSSLAVYDWGAADGRSSIAEDFPTAPRTTYGTSKLAGELAVRSYHEQGWLTVAVLRLAGLYGPGRFRGGSRFGPLLQRTLARAMAGETVAVSPGLAGHEYLHAADAAHAVRLTLEREAGGIHNVGTGRLRGAADVADAIRYAVPGADVTAAAAPTPVGAPLDVARMRGDFPGWRCRSLREGMADLAGALRDHPWLAAPAAGAPGRAAGPLTAGRERG